VQPNLNCKACDHWLLRSEQTPAEKDAFQKLIKVYSLGKNLIIQFFTDFLHELLLVLLPVAKLFCHLDAIFCMIRPATQGLSFHCFAAPVACKAVQAKARAHVRSGLSVFGGVSTI
jgi:hypothetical protein